MTIPSKPSKKKTDWTVIIGDVLGTAVSLFVESFWLMLFLGVGHASARVIPAFGYWTCVWLVIALCGIVAFGTFGLHQRVRSLTKDYGKKSPPTVLEQLINRSK